MEDNNVIKTNEVINNKYSATEFIEDNSILEVQYLPFDSKLQIASQVLMGVIDAVGGLNTSLLRRVATETFIEAVSNIDMNIEDENGLKGYDQLCFYRQLDNLAAFLGYEYEELWNILNERVQDYIRTETNPAVTINAIYNQIKEYWEVAMNYISSTVKNVDVEKLTSQLSSLINKDGVVNES